jgi:hypothetical protein
MVTGKVAVETPALLCDICGAMICQLKPDTRKDDIVCILCGIDVCPTCRRGSEFDLITNEYTGDYGSDTLCHYCFEVAQGMGKEINDFRDRYSTEEGVLREHLKNKCETARVLRALDGVSGVKEY